MIEKNDNLTTISQKVFKINKEKGFWDKEINIGEKLMLIVTELSEALEAHRGRSNILDRNKFETHLINDKEADFKEGFELYVKDTFEDEIADSVIRLFDLCGGLNIDLHWHVTMKLIYNKFRPHKHGKIY